MIRSHVKKEWNVDIPWHQIRRYLKQSNGLSFKKGSTRRVDLDLNRLSYLRILYSIRFTKQINKEVLMINIDEVNFSPEVLNRRSWLKAGINWELFSMKYTGAISMIWAISSTRNYIAATLNFFTRFKHLHRIFEDDWYLDSKKNYKNYHRRVLIILNNWSIHRSSLSKEYMKTKDYWYMFLPQYTPSLAPIELTPKPQTGDHQLNDQVIRNYVFGINK